MAADKNGGITSFFHPPLCPLSFWWTLHSRTYVCFLIGARTTRGTSLCWRLSNAPKRRKSTQKKLQTGVDDGINQLLFNSQLPSLNAFMKVQTFTTSSGCTVHKGLSSHETRNQGKYEGKRRMELKQGRKGVELETSRLKGHHSTTELQPLPILPVTQNEGQNNYKFSVFFVLGCAYLNISLLWPRQWYL